MDTGTKIVVLLTAIIGCATAFIAYKTAKLKGGNSQSDSNNSIEKNAPGPFDPMWNIVGAFGVVVAPMLVLLIFFVAAKFLIQLASTNRFPNVSAANQSVEWPDRKTLSIRDARFFDMGQVAAGMTMSGARVDALRHVVELALAEKAYLMALLAASEMQAGGARNDALTLVAISAASGDDSVAANRAVRAMSESGARNDAARRVIEILQKRSAPALDALGSGAKK